MTNPRLGMWMTKIGLAGLMLYTVGAALTWLFVGQVTDDWHKAVKVGATVAIIGVVLDFVDYLLIGDDPAVGFVRDVMFAAIPIGLLAGRAGGPGWATWFWITVSGAVLFGLIYAKRWLRKKCGTS
jgi:hypothetical protein